MISFVVLAISTSIIADPVNYSKPQMLIEPAALMKEMTSFHLLDVRTVAAINEGRIPGGMAVELSKWSKAVIEGKADANYWKKALQEVGVTPDKPTVVYGTDLREVCRCWWILKYAGVKDVRILNGGVDGFIAAGGKTTKTHSQFNVPVFDWKMDSSRIASKAELKSSVNQQHAQIVDGRSTDEFQGATSGSKKKGHVPGAKSLEWSDLLEPNKSRFKSEADLSKILADHKLDLAKSCTTYCQSGGRSSVVAFGLELMGAKEVRNYYRSWAEWGNADDTPIEK